MSRSSCQYFGPLVLVAMLAGEALAQQSESVKSLLDRGGRKLSREEVLQLVTGATVSGIQAHLPNRTFKNQYKVDGTLSGGGVDADSGRNFTSWSGAWSIDADGRGCIDVKNAHGIRVQSCSTYFVLDGSYFAEGEKQFAGTVRPISVQK